MHICAFSMMTKNAQMSIFHDGLKKMHICAFSFTAQQWCRNNKFGQHHQQKRLWSSNCRQSSSYVAIPGEMQTQYHLLHQRQCHIHYTLYSTQSHSKVIPSLELSRTVGSNYTRGLVAMSQRVYNLQRTSNVTLPPIHRAESSASMTNIESHHWSAKRQSEGYTLFQSFPVTASFVH